MYAADSLFNLIVPKEFREVISIALTAQSAPSTLSSRMNYRSQENFISLHKGLLVRSLQRSNADRQSEDLEVFFYFEEIKGNDF